MIDNLIKRVIDAGLQELDSHSPSRVFANLGVDVHKGLADGLPQSDDDD